MAFDLFKKAFGSTSAATPAPAQFLSPFGGFWTDTREALVELQSAVHDRTVDAAEAELLKFWIANGYAVIPGVLDATSIKRVQSAIDTAIDTGSRQMTYWDKSGKHEGPARRDQLAAAECKVIDVHANLPAVQEAIFAPKLARFFELVMRSKATAFQTLYFENGSEQGFHQDTAFVYVDPPLEFVASWIALEDIQAGSGELIYFPGSHRLPDLLFGNPPSKAMPPGDPAGADYSARLSDRSLAAGLAQASFLPKAGDALIWAADLVHGGSARKQQRTRRSLVTHYCPIHRQPPYASHGGTRVDLPNGHRILSLT
jgi:ectoine hydroxylase-related dioxygenase (phytanoyl-CoA dioxygenase family)